MSKYQKGLNLPAEILDTRARTFLFNLKRFPECFIVNYPQHRIHCWFFVQSPDSKESQIINEDLVNYLIEKKWIFPELSDEEFNFQSALGTIDGRIYKINRKKMK